MRILLREEKTIKSSDVLHIGQLGITLHSQKQFHFQDMRLNCNIMFVNKDALLRT